MDDIFTPEELFNIKKVHDNWAKELSSVEEAVAAFRNARKRNGIVGMDFCTRSWAKICYDMGEKTYYRNNPNFNGLPTEWTLVVDPEVFNGKGWDFGVVYD